MDSRHQFTHETKRQVLVVGDTSTFRASGWNENTSPRNGDANAYRGVSMKLSSGYRVRVLCTPTNLYLERQRIWQILHRKTHNTNGFTALGRCSEQEIVVSV